VLLVISEGQYFPSNIFQTEGKQFPQRYSQFVYYSEKLKEKKTETSMEVIRK